LTGRGSFDVNSFVFERGDYAEFAELLAIRESVDDYSVLAVFLGELEDGDVSA
jgi:hypothetical protein